MNTPDIIDAEAVEVPKPERPELKVYVYFCKRNGWIVLGQNITDSELNCVATIPGSAAPAPAPAPATDVVAATTELCKLGHYVEYAYDGDDIWCSVRDAGRPPITQQSGATADIAAARCLAKIRGAK